MKKIIGLINNNRGLSALTVAVATVFILGLSASLMMTDVTSSSRIRNHLRLSLQAYNIIEQLALRFRSGFEIRNPPWFIASSCPISPVATTDQGAAPTGGRYCSYPPQNCPAGTTLRNIPGGLSVCLADDLDGNPASPDSCIRSNTGSDYCLDFPSLVTSIDSHSEETPLPTLEIPLIDKTSWHRKFSHQITAWYENIIQISAPYLDPLSSSYAAGPPGPGLENFLSAKPASPPIGATSNLANIPLCVDAPHPGGGGNFCIRCADTDVNCIQIVLCMPPGCGAGGGQRLYQRIAILRARP